MARKKKYGLNEIDLDKVIGGMLEDYSEEVARRVGKKVEKVADETVEEIERTAPKRTGKYAKSWTDTFQYGLNRLDRTATVYSTKPGLPHLLEHGHATKGGGRTRAFVHVKPAEEKAVKKFEQEVLEAIDNAGKKV